MKKAIALIVVSMLSVSVASVEAAPNDHRTVRPVKQKSLKRLPQTHHRVMYAGKPYYFANGRFYNHRNGVYVATSVLIGAIVPALPGGYITVGVGSNRYYHFSGIYYRPAPTGYVVIERPVETTSLHADTPPLMVYPAAGQSDEQRGRDKYECYEWAKAETDYDPTRSNSNLMLKDDYQRAMGACLEGRNYVVK